MDYLGERWWEAREDGFHENKHVIDKSAEYSYGQGLAKRLSKAEELFAPNTPEAIVVKIE